MKSEQFVLYIHFSDGLYNLPQLNFYEFALHDLNYDEDDDVDHDKND